MNQNKFILSALKEFKEGFSLLNMESWGDPRFHFRDSKKIRKFCKHFLTKKLKEAYREGVKAERSMKAILKI